MLAQLFSCVGFLIFRSLVLPNLRSPLVAPVHQPPRGLSPVLRADSTVKGYFASTDVVLLERKEEDVAAFHEKERNRWDVVYDEDYYARHGPGGQDLEFYPGDRVEVVNSVKVKEIEDVKGMQGVVSHYEFDDGYESCQTCSTSCPVTVLLDEPE